MLKVVSSLNNNQHNLSIPFFPLTLGEVHTSKNLYIIKLYFENSQKTNLFEIIKKKNQNQKINQQKN